MPVQEEVLIVLKAKDEVSQVISSLRRTIEDLGRTFNGAIPNASDFTAPLNAGVDGLDSSIEKTSYSMSGFGHITSEVGSQANINFTQMAERMDKFHVGLNRVTNAMTGLFGTMGLWGMANESWTFATQRQTNQIYLGMRRGTDEAKQMYNEIQNIVMELPGDDTFLTTILTQASGRDMTMSIENVRTLGDAIADYYVGASAKGQLSYETQRELTSYILTGETRMFTNSILADEIDLLKNKNTVTERATALQEALNKTGFEGMAHYDSARNAMEEFKGHFQKAFADLGTWVLPVIQAVLGLYNALDTLAGNGLISAGLISLATGIALVTTALGTIGFVTPMINEGVRSLVLFGQGLRNIREGIADGGVFVFLKQHISDLVSETKMLVTPLEEVQALTTANATEQIVGTGWTSNTFATGFYELENGAIISNTQLKLQNMMATAQLNEVEMALEITKSGLTYEEYLNNVGLDLNTKELLANISARTGRSEAELLDIAMKSDLTTAEYLETLQTNLNSIETDKNSLSKIFNAEAEATATATEQTGIYVRIRSTAINVYHTIVNYGKAISEYVKGDATAWNELVENSAILTDLKSIYTSIAKTVQNYIEAISEYVKGDATAWNVLVENSQILTDIKSIATSIGKTIAKTVEAISIWLTTDATFMEALATATATEGTIALTIASSLLDIALAPITLTILAIVGAILLLVVVIEKVGEAFGWWSDFGSMFDAIVSGLQRMWDAFVNSEPVQQIITTFQNLWYTLETFWNFLGTIGGGLWELIFGVGQNEDGTLDIVGIILEIGGAIGNFIYWLSPLEEILSIFNAIGSAIGYFLDTWNEFVDTPEMQQVIAGFQEVRVALGEVWEELGTAFDEIRTALGEIFGAFSGSETEEATEGTNILLEVLKAVAWVLNTITIPMLKAMVDVIKLIITPIKWLADVLKWVASGFQDTGDSVDSATESGIGFLDLFGFIGDSLQNLWNIMQPILDVIVQVIDVVIAGAIDGLTQSIQGLYNIFNAIVGVIQFVIGVFNGLWSAIGGLDGIVNGLSWAFGGLLGFLKDVGYFLNDIYEKAKWVVDTFGWVGDTVSDAVNGVTDFFSQDGNLTQTQNVNYGADSSMGLLDSVGVTPDQLMSIGNTLNTEWNNKNQEYLNRPINNAQSNDAITKYLRDSPIDAEAYGYLTQPVDYSKTPTMTEPYKTVNSNQQQIVQNIFNEGSVQADARNMSAKDVQTLFTGAFGYNKARGTQGIIK